MKDEKYKESKNINSLYGYPLREMLRALDKMEGVLDEAFLKQIRSLHKLAELKKIQQSEFNKDV